MNQLAINLNNDAVTELKIGNVVKSFEMLSQASILISKAVVNHVHTDTNNSTYRFHWVDCHAMYAPKNPSSPSSQSPPAASSLQAAGWDGSSAFLFLRGLRVTTPCNTQADIDNLCPCGYAWVVWYNLAICCSLLGTRLGERGQTLLKTAFDLYDRVQRRIDNEPSSKQWNILQMAVLNNQACIYHDFAMDDAICASLERLAATLQRSPCVQGADRESFLLNLQILASHLAAPAA